MVFPELLVILAEWVLYRLLANSCYRAARKLRGYGFQLKNFLNLSKAQSPHNTSHLLNNNHQQQQNQDSSNPLFPSIAKYQEPLDENRACSVSPDEVLVCDIDGVLLRQLSSRHFHAFFPYFMLIAFEGGSIIRAIFLLLSCSFLWALPQETKLKVLSFITFSGLKVKDMESVSRSVLPKFFLDNLSLQVYDVWARTTYSKVVFTSLPQVMVERFLREHLSADDVIGTKMQEIEVMGRKVYTGLASGSGFVVKHRAAKDYFFDDNNKKPSLGIGSSSSLQDHSFISICKEAYLCNEEEVMNKNNTLPRERYPKPLIFHDGRLAFLPTPLATLTMFMWLPIGFFLAVFRISIGVLLPYHVANILAAMSGVRITFKTHNLYNGRPGKGKTGVLYVCNHRTLLDPVFLTTSLGKPLTAVTYSLSKFSELIAPLKTVSLKRDRKRDGEAMQRLLSKGDIVVCPEGTTCREPYLLRFSPLFAELTEDIVPVAVDAKVSMFYGTTASGLKCLDPIFFLMNPRPAYSVEVLKKLPKEMTCAGGKSSFEVANFIQGELAKVLGFECTNLTRKDKYLVLAGNEGIVT
ncbi:Glycerol-3-phosphate acyltransferase 1 [Raphanus sativus]|uniref:Glycerol-3-phosphate acyltransferase 1 n=1 Tax=Raphanus sativus TaxID=3726 RepID=A0A6J0MM49_RAPSA|nr:glycerol-3-phosphate acyltransferase 1 [Raphanus sativus]XP_056861537.1 glycerol-3-phosphate acyltransferase 1 [Raphanus sativus]KAJ4872612.1 Glycerol-3-phosphate acyltransferase 1 [Raphanus sativus]KAJ4915202.1 Glycerol-3-phosphate acyltransferase 1 [Raphanus sativus]